jgi:hypothetical protein
MNGFAGLSPSKNRKPEGSTLSGYAANLRKECAGLVAGQAVRTAEIGWIWWSLSSWAEIEQIAFRPFSELFHELVNSTIRPPVIASTVFRGRIGFDWLLR